jgi:hypothetical protein
MKNESMTIRRRAEAGACARIVVAAVSSVANAGRRLVAAAVSGRSALSAGVRVSSLSVLLACVGSNTAMAHHSFSAEFDVNQPIELTGTVTELKWSNPHTWIYIDVVDDDGNVVNWALETPRAANALIRSGWRPSDLPVGRIIQVQGWLARNGSPTANISSVTLEDGRRLFAGSPTPETGADEDR